LGAARAAYPQAPQPWIDLSTGINPRAYPAPRAQRLALNRLPDVGDLRRLEAVAAASFGVNDPERVVATGGTEPALRLLPYVLSLSQAIVAAPTYGSHADGWQAAGIPTELVADSWLEESIADRSAVVVVNPNNPDGRLLNRKRLQRLHDAVAQRGGVLVVDEAFAEAVPQSSVAALAGTEAALNLLVLRSFGKFFGLAGMRLGFVIGAPKWVARLRAAIGDWPVSADALVAGLAAYADLHWAERTRVQLAKSARRLDELLIASGFGIVGGTPLYRLARKADATLWFDRLAAAGILTRPFQHDPALLRFGLPGAPEAWRRLRQVLAGS
jgi:cobalamin biosynthetic protein CobC